MRIFQLTWQGEFALNSKKSVHAQRSRGVAILSAIVSLLFISAWLSSDAGQSGLISPVIGGGFLLLAIWMFRSRIDVTLNKNSIHVRRRTLFSSQTFEDPIDAYRGVIQTTTLYKKIVAIWGVGFFFPSIEDTTMQRVELVHPQRNWTVPIYQNVSEHLPRSKWEHYAKRFKLPMLIVDGKRLIERAPEDVDKTIKQLAEEGKLPDATTDGAPPWTFKVHSTDDLISIIIRRPAVGWWWLAIAFAIPASILIARLASDEPGSLSELFLVFLVLASPTFYLASIRRHVLVCHDKIEWMLKHPFIKGRVTDQINLKEIEQVSLRKIIGDGKTSLLLSGDRHSMTIARGVKPRHLEWLRDLIISAIVTA